MRALLPQVHSSIPLTHYNKLSKYYPLLFFGGNRDIWIDKIIQFDSIGEKATYKRYNLVTLVIHTGTITVLLEGSAEGIGLAIGYLINV
jgi:hypothetical protein